MDVYLKVFENIEIFRCPFQSDWNCQFYLITLYLKDFKLKDFRMHSKHVRRRLFARGNGTPRLTLFKSSLKVHFGLGVKTFFFICVGISHELLIKCLSRDGFTRHRALASRRQSDLLDDKWYNSFRGSKDSNSGQRV